MKEEQTQKAFATKAKPAAGRELTEDRIIRRDRMRFKKNKTSANLTLLAILLNVLYFVNLYQQDKGENHYYHSMIIGISIVYNLIFMLAAFLAEEGVKNYKKNYSFPLIVLGVIQIGRIFILPMDAHSTVLSMGQTVMGNGQFTYLVVLLVLSAVCLLVAAAVNLVKCSELAAHMKTLEVRPDGTRVLAGKSA